LGQGDAAAQEGKREERRGLRGSWTEARPTRKGKEGERGVSSGWAAEEKGERRGSPREKGEWAGVAHAGRGRGKKELGRARWRFGLPSFIPSPFLFFFYTLTIQTILFEFK
jgi:hypothetical protein